MLVTTRKVRGHPPILKLAGDLCNSNAVSLICNEIAALRDVGTDAVALDLSHANCNGFAAAFALVEVATREATSKIAIFSAPSQLKTSLAETGMLRFLNIFDHQEMALNSIAFEADILKDTKAIILCAGNGTRMSPLSSRTPKPMLDILGKPIVERLIDHLSAQGVRQFLLNPGHLGHDLLEYFCPEKFPKAQIQFFPEGTFEKGIWQARPIGSASTLVELHRKYRAITDDVIVLCGDALTDIDVNAMLRHHRSTGAAATIAAMPVPVELVSQYGIIVTDDDGTITSFQEKPARSDAKSNVANIGIYILSASYLDLLPANADLDIAQDLLVKLLENGEKLTVFSDDFVWQDMGCGKDYFDVLTACLKPDSIIEPVGKQVRPGLWVHESAFVSPKATIFGDCYIGADCQIEGGVSLFGPTVVGANCAIERGATIRNSAVVDGTIVTANTSLSGVVASDSWVTRHRLATGKNVEIETNSGLRKRTPDLHVALSRAG